MILAMMIVLLGAPGSGKGTQAKLLAERLGWVHIATGDLVRREIAKGTPLGDRMKALIGKGNLVDDETVFTLLKDELDRLGPFKGYILDGFCRTVAQAERLEELTHERDITFKGAALIDVPDEEIMERLSARWVCTTCGASYNTALQAPKKEGLCDVCHTALTQRADDTPVVIQRRLEEYHQQVKAIIAFYKAKGCLYEINGSRPNQVVFEDLMEKMRLSV